MEQLRVADAQREAAIDVTRREMEARLTRSEAEAAKLADARGGPPQDGGV